MVPGRPWIEHQLPGTWSAFVWTYWTCSQQPGCHIKLRIFQFVVDSFENSAQCGTANIWIVDLPSILLLLNRRSLYGCCQLVVKDVFPLLQGKLGLEAHTVGYLNFGALLGISHRGFQTNKSVLNIINYILSTQACINTITNPLHTIFLTLYSSILLRTIQSISIMISSWVYVPWKSQAGIIVSVRSPAPHFSLPYSPSFQWHIVSICDTVSTWKHWKGSGYIKSVHMQGDSSIPHVHISIYFLCPIHLMPSST